jgi:hypothetical protein
MIAGVLRNVAEKIIQLGRHSCHRDPIFLALVFLFKDKSNEVGTQEVYGGLIELFSEDFGVEVRWVFDELAGSVDLLSRD